MKKNNLMPWLWLALTVMCVALAVVCAVKQTTYPWWSMLISDIDIALLTFILYCYEKSQTK